MTPWTAAHQASVSFTISPSLLNSCPLSCWCHPSISSSIVSFSSCLWSFSASRVFSSESALHIRWPNYGNLSFSISPSNEYLGLISFRINWFDLLAVHNLKVLVLWCLAFFMVQHSHPYTTTGKTTALNIWTFVGKVMSLLFTAYVCHSINFYI